MARGTWDDFTDKYGFSDGVGVETRDFDVRDDLAKRLNEMAVEQKLDCRFIPFDRDGVHNPCLILVVGRNGTEGKTDADVIGMDLPCIATPDELVDAADDIIGELYDQLDPSRLGTIADNDDKVLFDAITFDAGNKHILPADRAATGGMSNVKRAQAVFASLHAFAPLGFGNTEGEDAYTVIGDFVTDLMHLCRLTGLEFDEILRKGRMHYDDEKAGV